MSDFSIKFSKAISESLPEAMQIADRFHLHQNLLKAVKDALNGVTPKEIPVPNDYGLSIENNETGGIPIGESNIYEEELPFYLGGIEKSEANMLKETVGNLYTEEIDEPTSSADNIMTARTDKKKRIR